jgi:ABC-type uncharacterized transport system substrate-binding protein
VRGLIDYRHADNQYDRPAALAAEFVRRQVTVIVALTSPPALAAKAATTTIPIVFTIPDDPVKLGLVAGLSHPDGNATGVSFVQRSWLKAARALARTRSKRESDWLARESS